MSESCFSCRYFHPPDYVGLFGQELYGECRRRAPTKTSTVSSYRSPAALPSAPPDIQGGYSCGWPSTPYRAWCGEWAAQTEAQALERRKILEQAAGESPEAP